MPVIRNNAVLRGTQDTVLLILDKIILYILVKSRVLMFYKPIDSMWKCFTFLTITIYLQVNCNYFDFNLHLRTFYWKCPGFCEMTRAL